MLKRTMLTVPPMGNGWVQGLASAALFSPDQCRQLRDELATADVVGHNPSELLQLACFAVEQANDQYFRLDVHGMVAPDEPKLIKLSDGDRARTFGLGLTPTDPTRKLLALLVIETAAENAAAIVIETGKSVAVELGQILMTPAHVDLGLQASGGHVWVAAFHALGPSFR